MTTKGEDLEWVVVFLVVCHEKGEDLTLSLGDEPIFYDTFESAYDAGMLWACGTCVGCPEPFPGRDFSVIPKVERLLKSQWVSTS